MCQSLQRVGDARESEVVRDREGIKGGRERGKGGKRGKGMATAASRVARASE